MADEPKRPGAVGSTWVATLPCPRCGNYHVLGLLLTDEEGKHQHTHYVCTFYGSGRRAACGWHGWTVPGWDETRPSAAGRTAPPG